MANSPAFTGNERYKEEPDVHIIPCASKSPDSDPHSLENDVNNFEYARSCRSSSSEPPSLSDFPFDDGCSSSSESHRSYTAYNERDESSDEEPVVVKGIDRFFESSDSEDGSETRQSIHANRERPDMSPEKSASQVFKIDSVYSPNKRFKLTVSEEDIQKRLSELIENAVAETVQIYKTVPPDQMRRFHDHTKTIARELQQKYQNSSSE